MWPERGFFQMWYHPGGDKDLEMVCGSTLPRTLQEGFQICFQICLLCSSSKIQSWFVVWIIKRFKEYYKREGQ